MVFEAIVVDVLNRVLGNYVENLNSSQLKLGIWGGDVVLENLILKQNALEELHVPIKTIYGRLGKLSLKIPWKNLYGASVEAKVERLFLVVHPLVEVKYDPVKEEQLALAAKHAELVRIEEAKKIADSTNVETLNETFVEKLVTQIIKNVQVKITDIHIRYEDTTTNPSYPFALGITLHNISIYTTDEKWEQTVVDESVTRVFKICELNGLAFYWNPDTSVYSKKTTDEITSCLQKEIATKSSKPVDYHYILGPINAVAKLKLNPNPQLDDPQFSIPKVKLSLDVEELTIGLNKDQYRDIVLLADSMDRMAKGTRFRKYRPQLNSYKGHYKEWWHFAYKCVLEEEVRRVRNNWDWNHMLNHRNLCRRYAEAYQNKLMYKDKLSAADKAALEDAEKQLDVLNLVIIRQKIELEVARQQKFESKDDKQSGWFSWFWSSKKDSTAGSADAHFMDQIEQAMTPEEKSKLYRAIDYQENTAPVHFPIEYAGTKCIFFLKKLQLIIRDEEQVILTASLDEVAVQMTQRPAGNALKLEVEMRLFTVWGSKQGNFLPRLVTSKNPEETNNLLSVEFETNPISESADQVIKVSARPLQIIYDATTVIELAEMFSPSHDSSALATLQAAAGTKMDEIKGKSALAMQYAVQQHTFVDLDINIEASYIVVPKLGKFAKETEPCVVMNLGAISVKSEPRDEKLDVARLWRDGYDEETILREVTQHSYDKITINVTDVQFVIANEGEDWLSTIRQNSPSPLHLLQPTTLTIQVHKCVIMDDPRLPKIKVNGELQQIALTISEERLLTLFEIFLSMPMPETHAPEPLKKNKFSSAMLLKYLDPNEKKKRDEQRSKQNLETTVQLTEVEAFFIMNELVICVNRRLKDQTIPNEKFMVFSLRMLEIAMTQRTFNMEASVKLESVDLQHHRRKGEILYVMRTNENVQFDNTEPHNPYLFLIQYINVNKECPEFRSVYKSVEQMIQLNFTNLTVRLHMESLQEILMIANEFQNRMQTLSEQVDRQGSAGKLASVKESEILPVAIKSRENSLTIGQQQSQRHVVESIQLKVAMDVSAIEIQFVTDQRPLSSIQLQGAAFRLIMKTSYMQVDTAITSIKVDDLNPLTIHKEIMKVLGGEVFKLTVVMYNIPQQAPNDVNMMIKGQINCLRIVYLNWFVSSMLEFLNNFQAAQQAIIEASAQAADAARANVQNVYETAQKISLKLRLAAPIIVVPENSTSLNVVIIDLGRISIKNRFIDIPIPGRITGAIFDELTLTLENLKISCTHLDKVTHLSIAKDEHLILKPTSSSLLVTRSLSPWCQQLPDLECSGSFKSIYLILGKNDYKSLMRIMNQNLQEGYAKVGEEKSQSSIQELVPSPRLSGRERLQSISKSVQALTHSDLIQTTVPKVTIKFSFSMESFIIDLRTTINEENSYEQKDVDLGRFALELMSVKGSMMSDDSMKLSFVLVDCTLDDLRPGRKNKISRYLERRSKSIGSVDSPQNISNMIDLTYSTKMSDTFIDFKISSFELILAMDFLNKVSEFIVKGLAENTPEELKKDTLKYAETTIDKQKQALEEATPAVMTLNIKIEQPDIILVESMEHKQCNALVLHMEAMLKIRKTEDTMAVEGGINDMLVEVREVNCDIDETTSQQPFAAYPLRGHGTEQSSTGERAAASSPIEQTLVVSAGCASNPILAEMHEPRYVLAPTALILTYSQPPDQGVHLDLTISNITITITPDVVALLNRVLATVAKVEDAENEVFNKTVMYSSDLWTPQPLQRQAYWFLRAEQAKEAIEQEIIEQTVSEPKSEICFFSCPRIEVTFEIEIGTERIPVLSMEASLNGQVKDWSSNMHLESIWRMEVSYYNVVQASWEPIVEPVELMYNEVGDTRYEPWELKMEIIMHSNENYRAINTKDEAENLKFVAQRLPNTMVKVTSSEPLELTLTSSGMDVLTQLSNSYYAALEENPVKTQTKFETTQRVQDDPYVLHNYLGIPVKIVLSENSDFEVAAAQSSEGLYLYKEIMLKPEAMLGLRLKHGGLRNMKLNEPPPSLRLNLTIAQTNEKISLPVERVGKRYFPLWPSTKLGENPQAIGKNEVHGFISDVVMQDYAMQIYLQGFVTVHNLLSVSVNVYYMTWRGVEVDFIGTVKPGDSLRLPLYAIYTATGELFFSVEGFTLSVTPFIWRELNREHNITKLLECESRIKGSEEKFYIQAKGTFQQVYSEDSTRYTVHSHCYNIVLKPAVKLQNCLPINITVSQMGVNRAKEFAPGEMFHLSHLEPYKANIVILIKDYLDKCWACTKCLPAAKKEELTVWTFESHDSPAVMLLFLGMQNVDDGGTQILALYCPFWMLNKTGLTISYKSGDPVGNVIFHPKDFVGPILFSFHSKIFFAKKKAMIRVEFGEWSEEFSLDVPGSSGLIECKYEGKHYNLAVTNQLTFNSLTKMVIFTPFCLISNEALFDIEFTKDVYDLKNAVWEPVSAQSTAPLWPARDSTLLVLRVAGTEENTAPFIYNEHYTVCLKLNNQYGGLKVQVEMNEGGTQISVRQYWAGDAPALLINYTQYSIKFWEKYHVQTQSIPPMNQLLFCWENPAGPRNLIFQGYNEKYHSATDLMKDCIGELNISPNEQVSWVSFLDGMQRVVLLTDDPILASGAHTIGDAEMLDTEVEIAIQGIGLSLVNDVKHQEVIYISMCSSGIVWESCRIGGRRYKKVSKDLSQLLEKAYQRYLNQKAVKDADCTPIVDLCDKTKVDLEQMRLLRPSSKMLRRTLEAGLWMSLGMTAHTKRIHARLHRLQIDQQLPLPTYPVVLAPVRPPKSITADATPKPFMEVSIVERMMENSKMKQYNYYRVLIQEFHVKMDMGLVNALLEMFPQKILTEQEALEAFKLDLQTAGKPLEEMLILQPNEQKNFYDNLHLSPLKVHVSFSLGSETTLPTFVGTILSSIGVTLTNMNDVVLKLSYFERNYQFLSQNELYTQVTNHYKGQALKQFYVLVLGLDVLGNPYGLVIGLKKGVEDLFYEPFSGAIQGPGEFAEGLYLGVRSLVGHTVGGAADAVSRITGAMGHGLAALSLDKEYQRRRRHALNKTTGNLGEGLARSGKGLVMGVVEGVRGVVMLPMTGARRSGALGFVGGIGKGVLGLFVRPVLGFVDMINGLVRTIIRAADWSSETVKRRNARYLPPNTCVRPYSRQQAEGFKLLSEVEKGKFVSSDQYQWHVWCVPDKAAVLLTDKRILYIESNVVFGGFNLSWSFLWTELRNVKVNNADVVIECPNTSFFRIKSNHITKKIHLESEAQRNKLEQMCNTLIQTATG